MGEGGGATRCISRLDGVSGSLAVAYTPYSSSVYVLGTSSGSLAVGICVTVVPALDSAIHAERYRLS